MNVNVFTAAARSGRWPRARSVALTLFKPSRRSRHSFCRRCCWWCTERLMRFAGGWPRTSCSSAVATSVWSCCSAPSRTHSEGCRCPTMFAKAWFQPSHTLFVRSRLANVASWTFHTVGGNKGGVRRACRSSRRLSVLGTRRRTPLTYAASKYASNCCNSATSSGMCWRRYASLSCRSATGMNASPSSMQQKWRAFSRRRYNDESPSSWIWHYTQITLIVRVLKLLKAGAVAQIWHLVGRNGVGSVERCDFPPYTLYTYCPAARGSRSLYLALTENRWCHRKVALEKPSANAWTATWR